MRIVFTRTPIFRPDNVICGLRDRFLDVRGGADLDLENSPILISEEHIEQVLDALKQMGISASF